MKELVLEFGMEGGGEHIYRESSDSTVHFIRKFSYMKFDLDDWETGEERIDSLDSFWNNFTKNPRWYRFHPVKVHKNYRELVLKSLHSIDITTINGEDKRRIDCWVEVVMDGKYDSDYPFKNLCRLHQSQYRSEVLKVWFDDDINVLNDEDGLKGLNFYDGFDILKSVEERYGDRYKGGFRKPLYCNLLRSEHIPFNFFIPFKHDLNFGKQVFNEILGGVIDHLIDIKIEYPEDTPTNYLKDRTSFDTYIEYKHTDGSNGFIGIEVKYTELSYPIGVKEKREMENPESLYYKRSRESGVFIDCDFNTLRTLSEDDFRQVWRNHLLGESILIVDKPKFGHFHSLTFYPEGNIHFNKVINEYQSFLKPEYRERVQRVTYERFFEICRTVVNDKEFKMWLKYLKNRYLTN